ncbi:MAG: polyamine aminopropyltransferase [Pseudomonadota bacterium]
MSGETAQDGALSPGASAADDRDAPRRGGVAGADRLLLAGVFLIAASGLAYELIAGAAASYLLGDSVTQYSLVIGVFMTAMGVGAWISRYVAAPEAVFCRSQLALGVLGGASAPLFYLAFALVEPFSVVLFGVVFALGCLSGLEIPLMMRILQARGVTRHALSTVLTLDYAGALAAAVAFPLLIVPWLGLLSASLVFGLMNLGVAWLALEILQPEGARRLKRWAGLAIAAGVLGLVFSERLIGAAEASLYQDEVVTALDTSYQRLVVTKRGERTRLFLDGALQFDSQDEHRYHEALAHPAMRRAERLRSVLILGGGDGMAAREALRYPIERLVLVDLDPAVTRLFSEARFAALNGAAFSDPRVEIIHADAFTWLAEGEERFDVIIADLPDPRTLSLSKLYSRAFYARLADRLEAGGAAAVQAGAPYYAPEAYWSVIATLESAPNALRLGEGMPVTPYAVWVPSFGLWGFALAGPAARAAPKRPLPEGLRMHTAESWAAMTHFTQDLARRPAEINTLRGHALLRYHREGWARHQ